MPVPNSLNYKVTNRGISISESVFDICPLSNSLSIVLVLFSLLVSSSSLLVANIVLSIISHLRPSHVPNFCVATAATLAFSKVGCLVEVADMQQVHSTIDSFVAIINVVHCKAIVKKTAVVNSAKAEEKYVKRVVS